MLPATASRHSVPDHFGPATRTGRAGRVPRLVSGQDDAHDAGLADEVARLIAGGPSRSIPRVVTFSPTRPGGTAEPGTFGSSWNSAWIRCTCPGLGCVGSCPTRGRCLTVSPVRRVALDAGPGQRPDTAAGRFFSGVRRAAADRGYRSPHGSHLRPSLHADLQRGAPRRRRARGPSQGCRPLPGGEGGPRRRGTEDPSRPPGPRYPGPCTRRPAGGAPARPPPAGPRRETSRRECLSPGRGRRGSPGQTPAP